MRIGPIFKIIGMLAFLSLIPILVVIVFIKSEPGAKYSNALERYSSTSLNIRSGPGANYEVLNTVQQNTKLLTADSISQGFVMILHDDSTHWGWASKDYLQLNVVTKFRF